MTIDKTLVRSVQTKCGGGKIHLAVQWTTAYEFAVTRYNHRNTKPREKPAIAREIEDLKSKLYGMLAQ